jgi:hypothetical protein
MTRFHFRICENGKETTDHAAREFADSAEACREAVETSLALASDLLRGGDMPSAQQVVIEVYREDDPFLRVSMSLEIERKMDEYAAKRRPQKRPEDF